jgi:hypothetical protein
LVCWLTGDCGPSDDGAGGIRRSPVHAGKPTLAWFRGAAHHNVPGKVILPDWPFRMDIAVSLASGSRIFSMDSGKIFRKFPVLAKF